MKSNLPLLQQQPPLENLSSNSSQVSNDNLSGVTIKPYDEKLKEQQQKLQKFLKPSNSTIPDKPGKTGTSGQIYNKTEYSQKYYLLENKSNNHSHKSPDNKSIQQQLPKKRQIRKIIHKKDTNKGITEKTQKSNNPLIDKLDKLISNNSSNFTNKKLNYSESLSDWKSVNSNKQNKSILSTRLSTQPNFAENLKTDNSFHNSVQKMEDIDIGYEEDSFNTYKSFPSKDFLGFGKSDQEKNQKDWDLICEDGQKPNFVDSSLKTSTEQSPTYQAYKSKQDSKFGDFRQSIAYNKIPEKPQVFNNPKKIFSKTFDDIMNQSSYREISRTITNKQPIYETISSWSKDRYIRPTTTNTTTRVNRQVGGKQLKKINIDNYSTSRKLERFINSTENSLENSMANKIDQFIQKRILRPPKLLGSGNKAANNSKIQKTEKNAKNFKNRNLFIRNQNVIHNRSRDNQVVTYDPADDFYNKSNLFGYFEENFGRVCGALDELTDSEPVLNQIEGLSQDVQVPQYNSLLKDKYNRVQKVYVNNHQSNCQFSDFLMKTCHSNFGYYSHNFEQSKTPKKIFKNLDEKFYHKRKLGTALPVNIDEQIRDESTVKTEQSNIDKDKLGSEQIDPSTKIIFESNLSGVYDNWNLEEVTNQNIQKKSQTETDEESFTNELDAYGDEEDYTEGNEQTSEERRRIWFENKYKKRNGMGDDEIGERYQRFKNAKQFHRKQSIINESSCRSIITNETKQIPTHKSRSKRFSLQRDLTELCAHNLENKKSVDQEWQRRIAIGKNCPSNSSTTKNQLETSQFNPLRQEPPDLGPSIPNCYYSGTEYDSYWKTVIEQCLATKNLEKCEEEIGYYTIKLPNLDLIQNLDQSEENFINHYWGNTTNNHHIKDQIILVKKLKNDLKQEGTLYWWTHKGTSYLENFDFEKMSEIGGDHDQDFQDLEIKICVLDRLWKDHIDIEDDEGFKAISVKMDKGELPRNLEDLLKKAEKNDQFVLEDENQEDDRLSEFDRKIEGLVTGVGGVGSNNVLGSGWHSRYKPMFVSRRRMSEASWGRSVRSVVNN